LSLLLTTKAALGINKFLHFCLFWCTVNKEYKKCFILHGKVAPVFRRSELSVHWQLHVIFLMLPTNNYKQKFKFVKVISRNDVSIFHLEYNDNGIFDDVIITSVLRSDMVI